MSTSISMLKLKDAALFSEHVIPVNFFIDYVWEFKKRNHNKASYGELIQSSGILGELLPPHLGGEPDFLKCLGDVNETLLPFMHGLFGNHYSIQPLTSAEEINARFCQFMDIFQKFIVEFGLGDVPIDIGDLLIEEDGSETSQPSVVLVGMNLVDTSNCEWAQILEFRKDKAAAVKLRNLRLHLQTEYSGKDRTFVEDDLRKRLDEYQSTIDEWGFETLTGSIGMLLSSKALAGGAAGSLVSILAEAPLPAVLSMTGAALLEAGQVTLYVQKQKFDLQHALQNNPVGFIKYAQKTLVADS